MIPRIAFNPWRGRIISGESAIHLDILFFWLNNRNCSGAKKFRTYFTVLFLLQIPMTEFLNPPGDEN